jgi:hypothetical protein
MAKLRIQRSRLGYTFSDNITGIAICAVDPKLGALASTPQCAIGGQYPKRAQFGCSARPTGHIPLCGVFVGSQRGYIQGVLQSFQFNRPCIRPFHQTRPVVVLHQLRYILCRQWCICAGDSGRTGRTGDIALRNSSLHLHHHPHIGHTVNLAISLSGGCTNTGI